LKNGLPTNFEVPTDSWSGSFPKPLKKPNANVKKQRNKYDVTKELFESVNEGDFIEIHTSKYSNILLGFKALK
jgi:hypothetical protein